MGETHSMKDTSVDTPDDILSFAKESDATISSDAGGNRPPWKILIVDDDQSVHEVTILVLKYMVFDGRGLEFHSVYTGTEAKEFLSANPDTAIVLLDVVMEANDAGLDVIRYLRGELKNAMTRIILRTGQPGSAPEEEVISKYDINDYKEKSELTRQKLFTTITTALRSYRDIISIERSRAELHKIVESSATIFKLQSLRRFCEAVLRQLSYLLNLDSDAVYLQADGFAAGYDAGSFKVLAATGSFSDAVDKPLSEVVPEDLKAEVDAVLVERKSRMGNSWYIAYFESELGKRNLVCIRSARSLDPLVLDLINIFNNDVSVAFNNLSLNQEVVDTQKELIFRLGEIVESRSQETSFHIRRVGECARLLWQGMGHGEDECEAMRLAAAMHDVGKLAIPDRILLKPDKLSDEEFEIIKTHTTIGYELMRTSERSIFQKAAEIALCHHERWDGTGYPRGLRGNEIPLSAQVTAIIDVFDALSTRRIYRMAWEDAAVLGYIASEADRAFSPSIVRLFMEHKDGLLAIRDSYASTKMGMMA